MLKNFLQSRETAIYDVDRETRTKTNHTKNLSKSEQKNFTGKAHYSVHEVMSMMSTNTPDMNCHVCTKQ